MTARQRGSLIAALLALALLPVAGSAPALADTLVDNVDGRTIGDKGGIERFTGLLIDNEGRIAAVLKQGDKRPVRVDYRVDGGGRVLLPGMIDSHVRLMDIGFASLTLDVRDASSAAQMQEQVAAYAARYPDRAWIIGSGWDDSALFAAGVPSVARPIWLTSRDGDAGWANGAALAAARITAATKDPAGGRIVRDRLGKPTGLLIGTARDLVARVVSPPRPLDRDMAFRVAQHLMLERGITAVADIGTTIEDWQTYRRAGDNGELSIRISAYSAGIEAMTLIAGPAPTPWLYADKLRLTGVTFTLDGSLTTRGALLKQPYADAPDARGLARHAPIPLRNLMSRAAMDGFQISLQATGDAAMAEALDAIGELAETYKGDRRWRIDRAQLLDPADLPRMVAHGIAITVAPQDGITDRSVAKARVGTVRLSGAFAWKSLASNSGAMAFGSFAPSHRADPLASLAAATEATDRPQERLDPISAFAAITAGGATAVRAEDRFGRIAPGLRADFVFVDTDPLLASPAQLRQTQVLETWIAGRKVYEKAETPAKPQS